MKIFSILIIFSFLVISSDPARARPDRLVLNASYAAPLVSPDGSGLLDRVYGELGRRLGMAIDIQLLPAERALVNVSNGIEDGDVCRVAGVEEMYPDLLRTDEPVMSYRHVVFSREREVTISGPASLEPYAVGIVTGLKTIEKSTDRARSRIMLDDAEQLFRMLDQGRVDMVVIERSVGMHTIGTLGLAGIKPLSPPLVRGDWYLLLHKRHASLVPLIDRELRAMKQDGSYRRIYHEVLGPYLQDGR